MFVHGSLDFDELASPFAVFLLASRLLSSLDLLCLCFFLLPCRGGRGGDNVHANAACI